MLKQHLSVGLQVPIFRSKSAQFITELIPKIRNEVFPPDEYVTIEVCVGPLSCRRSLQLHSVEVFIWCVQHCHHRTSHSLQSPQQRDATSRALSPVSVEACA